MGSPALLMNAGLVEFGTSENPVKNWPCLAERRPWINKGAGESHQVLGLLFSPFIAAQLAVS
jgi:hypothetical protein